ncbi:MAG TPA: hypothetical protein VM101_02255 [Flavitalea sp.]|nr:hypothetical protein [Flavitalea sp.]
MKSKKAANMQISPATVLSVCLMIFCLTFLTSVNFFIYSSDSEVITQNTSPSGPTEEKTGNTGVSFIEEILHESSFEFNSNPVNELCLHHIAHADELQIVHPELLLRPPRA